jgi:hypothetical protein
MHAPFCMDLNLKTKFSIKSENQILSFLKKVIKRKLEVLILILLQIRFIHNVKNTFKSNNYKSI